MLKLNIGCGANFQKDGWIGIDFEGTQAFWRQNKLSSSFLNLDIKDGLPFDDESADIIYISHCLEHFTYNEAVYIMSEIYRVLKTDGILQIVVPDLDIYINKLMQRDSKFLNTPDIIGGTPNNNLTDNFLMNFYSDPAHNNTCHKYAYNFENLTALLNLYKFKAIQKVNFQEFSFSTETNAPEFRCLSKEAHQFSLSVECRKEIHDPFYKKNEKLIRSFDNFYYLKKTQNQMQKQVSKHLCSEKPFYKSLLSKFKLRIKYLLQYFS